MRTIKLTQGQVALVDDDSYITASKVKWQAQKTKWGFYAFRTVQMPSGKRKYVPLHRCLLMMPRSPHVDHKNRNSLDNQKLNLRPCTVAQNHHNKGLFKNKTSKYKGVSWNAKDSRWISYIRVNKNGIYLGAFTDEIKAAKAYDAAAIEHFKEFANINFPKEM